MEKGFFDRVGDRISERKKRGEDILKRYNEGQNAARTAAQIMGVVGAGGINDIAGEAIGVVARPALSAAGSAIDFVDPRILEGYRNVGSDIAGSEYAQKLAAAMSDFKQENPALYDDISGALNFASLMPISTVAKPTGTVSGNILKKTGSAIEKSGVASDVAKKSAKVAERFMPKITDTVKKEATEAGLTKRASGLSGILGYQEVVPDARQSKMIGVMQDYVKAGALNPNKNASELAKDVNDLIVREAVDTNRILRSAGSTLTPEQIMQDVNKRMSQAAYRIMDSDFIGNDKNIANLVNDVYASAMGLIQKTNPTGSLSPADILEARKSLDGLIKMKFGQSTLDPASRSRLEALVSREMRNALNDSVVNTSPVGQSVRDSLTRQSALYDAAENLATKAPDEFGGLPQKILGDTATGVRIKRLGQGALGAGVIGGAAMTGLLPAVAGGAALYGAGKAIASPALRIGAGKAIKGAGSVVRAASKSLPEFGATANAVGAVPLVGNAIQNEAFTQQEQDVDQYLQSIGAVVDTPTQPQTDNVDDYLKSIGAVIEETSPPVQNSVSTPVTMSPFMERVAMAESGGDPNAQAATSSASGLFQFTDATWNSAVDKFGKKYGITRGMKNDPAAQSKMMEYLTADNARILQDRGIPATEENLYVAHFLGAPAASKAISKLGTGVPAARLFPSAAKANQQIFFDNQGNARTIEQVYDILASKVRV